MWFGINYTGQSNPYTAGILVQGTVGFGLAVDNAWVGGNPSVLSSPLTAGDWYRMTMDQNGANFTATLSTLDGATVKQLTDTSLVQTRSTGYAYIAGESFSGVGAVTGSPAYDNFSLTIATSRAGHADAARCGLARSLAYAWQSGSRTATIHEDARRARRCSLGVLSCPSWIECSCDGCRVLEGESSEIREAELRIYAGRIARGHHDHRHPDCAVAAGGAGGEGGGQENAVRQQPQADWRRDAQLRDGPRNVSARRSIGQANGIGTDNLNEWTYFLHLLLPYLEQQGYYQAEDGPRFNLPPPWQVTYPGWNKWQPLNGVPLPMFQCPDDPVKGDMVQIAAGLRVPKATTLAFSPGGTMATAAGRPRTT